MVAWFRSVIERAAESEIGPIVSVQVVGSTSKLGTMVDPTREAGDNGVHAHLGEPMAATQVL
jgi:hypothetical protein